MQGQIVDLFQFPSRGIPYPKDIEVYVKPLNIKEQIDITRYGISTAEYYQIILDGITIKGGFNKNNLLHADVQFIDIVRRLFSFDTADVITITGETCAHCGQPIKHSFKMTDITFTDFKDDIMNKKYTFMEGTEDEISVIVRPLTISEYIRLSKVFRNYDGRKDALSAIFFEYCCACIREVEGKEFSNMTERDEFLKDYLASLYKAKDKKTLKDLEDETTIVVKPFKVFCPNCEGETEVVVEPTTNFQQP